MAAGGSGESDALEKFLLDEMENWSIKTKDIPEDLDVDPSKVKHIMRSTTKRYYICKAFAHFDYHEYPTDHGRQHTKKWKSAHAWCTIDLKMQRIAHRFPQKCNQCEGESEPWFDNTALHRMAKYAVKVYLLKVGKLKKTPTQDDDDTVHEGPPHDEDRCDVCKQLGRSCWKKKLVPSSHQLEDEDGQRSDEDDQEYYDEEEYYNYSGEDIDDDYYGDTYGQSDDDYYHQHDDYYSDSPDDNDYYDE